jgi:ubiquinone biosynthesis protein
MKNLKRFSVIFHTLFPPFFTYAMVKNKPESKKYKDATFAIRKALQKLGPTYIKFGQMLSARPDLVGIHLADELRNLLDNEPIIPFEDIEKVLEGELKQPVKKVFRKIEHTPIATASIGQVHKATLHNNHVVALKVRRPGIETVIKNDLPVLKNISILMDIFIPLKGLKFRYVVNQFSEWITNEMDFQIEGHRADKFTENMKSVEGIHIPKIYWEHTTEKVLELEYIEGHTLNALIDLMKKQKVSTLYDLKTDFKINPDLLIERMIGAVAKQSLVDRFFHGDLHPANIIISKQNMITFVDFGIVGSLNEEEHTQILLCMLSLVESDPETLVKVITSLITDPLSPQEIGKLHQEFSDELHKMHEDIGGKVTVNHFLTALLPLSAKYHIQWSSGFLLAVKTIGQIDSVAGQIGLRKPLVELMKPEVEKALTTSLSTSFTKETLYKGLLDLVQAGKKLPQTLTELEDLIHSTDLNKLGQVVTSSQRHAFRNTFILGSAVIVAVPILSQTAFSAAIKPLLFIGIPLLFILILVKLFTIGRK